MSLQPFVPEILQFVALDGSEVLISTETINFIRPYVGTLPPGVLSAVTINVGGIDVAVQNTLPNIAAAYATMGAGPVVIAFTPPNAPTPGFPVVLGSTQLPPHYLVDRRAYETWNMRDTYQGINPAIFLANVVVLPPWMLQAGWANQYTDLAPIAYKPIIQETQYGMSPAFFLSKVTNLPPWFTQNTGWSHEVTDLTPRSPLAPIDQFQGGLAPGVFQSYMNIDTNTYFSTTTNATSTALSLTTTGNNEVVVVFGQTSSSATPSISDTLGSTWNTRHNSSISSIDLYVFWTVASTPWSSNTITLASTTAMKFKGNAISITNVNTTTPFSTGTLTQATNSGPLSMTVNAKSFLFGGSLCSNPAPGSMTGGWSFITNDFTNSNYISESQYVTGGGNYTFSRGTGNTNLTTGLLDAVQHA